MMESLKTRLRRLVYLSLSTALILVLAGVGNYKTVSAEEINANMQSTDDITLDVYEVSYLNYIGINGVPFTGTETIDAESARSLKTYSTQSISQGQTWYTLDGQWLVNGISSGNALKIYNYSYQGTDLNVTCDVPDFINFHYISNSELSSDEGKVKITTDSTVCTVTSISNAFDYNNNSTCVNLDLKIPKRVTIVDDRAFYNNTKLTSLKFEGDIQSIGSSAFEGCTRLKTLDLLGTLETVANNTIPDKCFYKCSSLEDIKIPNTILNIGREAFYQCNKIDSLLLSDSIKTIGSNAFAMCSNLRYLYIGSNYSNWTGVVDKSEVHKLVTGDISSPIVAKEGTTIQVSKNIYGQSKMSVFSKVDITDITVTRDSEPVSVTEIMSDVYGYDTIAYTFKADEKGLYVVKATDVLGNELDYSFSYTSDVIDTQKPVITITGEGADGNYQNARIEFKDNETSISYVALDGNLVSTPYIECDTEGLHTIVVRDEFNNEAKVSFLIDKTAPITNSVVNNEKYKQSKVITFVEEGSGIKDIILNGKSLGVVKSVDAFMTGKYKLTIVDKALNSTTYNFVIDTTGPTLENILDDKVYNKDLFCSAKSVAGIRAIKVKFEDKDKYKKEYYINNGAILSEEGIYKITIEDVLGTIKTYTVTLDKTAPVINGVTNNEYCSDETLDISIDDANFSTVLVNGVSRNKSFSLKEDGVYTILATDKAGNSSTVSFTKDSEAPVFDADNLSVKTSEYTEKMKEHSQDGKFIIYNKFFTIKVTDNIGVSSIKLNNKKISNNYKLTKSGSYNLVITDKAGNKTEVNFVIDATAPSANITKNRNYNKTIKLNVKDDKAGIESITLDGVAIKNKTKISKEGKHKLVLIDKYGNKSTIKFTIDKTKPTCSIKNGKTVKKGTKIKVSDKLSGIKSIKLNNKTIKNNYKLKKKGNQTLVIVDKAGNKTKIKFKVK